MFSFKILVFSFAVCFSNSLDLLNSPQAREFLGSNDVPNEEFKGIGGCANNPCKNGGVCQYDGNNTECICSLNYYGKTCDFYSHCDPCLNHPCKKGAKCYVKGNEAKCDCPTPHFGEICERSPCADNPCQNNGTCYIEDGKTVCSCASLYTGELCEQKGCFHGSAVVLTKAGEKLMKDILIDDDVASGFNPDGSLKFSKVIAFLHKDQDITSHFIQLKTESTSPLLITKKHLIYRSIIQQDSEAVYADQLRIGDLVYTKNMAGVTASFVTEISHVTLTGVYAPLTLDGTIIVNDVLASCYAEIDNHEKAHLAFLPLRLHYHLMNVLKSFYSLWNISEDSVQDYELFQQETIVYDKTKALQKLDNLGVHWYPKMLCWLFSYDCK